MSNSNEIKKLFEEYESLDNLVENLFRPEYTQNRKSEINEQILSKIKSFLSNLFNKFINLFKNAVTDKKRTIRSSSDSLVSLAAKSSRSPAARNVNSAARSGKGTKKTGPNSAGDPQEEPELDFDSIFAEIEAESRNPKIDFEKIKLLADAQENPDLLKDKSKEYAAKILKDLPGEEMIKNRISSILDGAKLEIPSANNFKTVFSLNTEDRINDALKKINDGIDKVFDMAAALSKEIEDSKSKDEKVDSNLLLKLAPILNSNPELFSNEKYQGQIADVINSNADHLLEQLMMVNAKEILFKSIYEYLKHRRGIVDVIENMKAELTKSNKENPPNPDAEASPDNQQS